MIHSTDWGVSDPLSVPLMAREMRKSRDFNMEQIEKVTFYNAYEFFKQSAIPGDHNAFTSRFW